jgi:hypothetical protein
MDWTPEQIERTRARILRDVSPEAVERGRRQRERLAALGTRKRCQTNACGPWGECLHCGADNGEACRT